MASARNHASLDRDQRGALRRMINLSEQLPDDWSGMMPRTSLQEDFGALRFQLAYMAYAMALTHVHRLPAAPGLFREPMMRLVEKLRSPDVWTYWHYVSSGNSANNRSLGVLTPEWNPIVKDNIMYSAYLQVAALLHHHLFDDARFAEPGGLSLTLRPLFWSDGPRTFVYDEHSLNQHIYWQMVENGYLGVACEPNCVFQICNQVPIHGFRLHDLIHGGDLAGEVTEGYRRAWADFGLLDGAGHFNVMALEMERTMPFEAAPWSDFWAGALMNAWNPEIARAGYPAQKARWILDGPNGTAWVDQAPGAFADAGLTCSYDFGWAAVCASELGDVETRDRLLAYADARLHRTWERGGLFHARHDARYDTDGLLSGMDPHTGNVLLGYARLNVADGLRSLYEGAWTPARKATPAILDIDGTLDFASAHYDAGDRILRWTVSPVEGRPGEASFRIGRLPAGAAGWTLRIDGEDIAPSRDGRVRTETGGADIRIALSIRAETDIQIRWH